MSQKAQILHYMRLHGAISPLTAVKHIGCLRLSERCREINEDFRLSGSKERVVNIGKMVTKPDGKRVKIGYYRLA